MAKAVLNHPRFLSEKAAFEYVEARLWPNGPVCPHCEGEAKVGRLNGPRLGLHKCYGCRKQFTVRIGTIFEDSHLPLHLWLQIIHLMCASKKGISTRQIQRMLNCSMKTAWFLGHRIREAMKPLIKGPLGGEGVTVEADETWITPKAGMKLKRPAVNKQTAVLSLVERDGAIRSFHVPNVRAETLRAAIAANVSAKSHFVTDELRAYTYIGWNFASHETVNHSIKEFSREGTYTNTVEGAFSILKRGLNGIYQHVSHAHLQRYLHEFDFRYTNRERRGIDDVSRADIALQGFRGRRLTYQTVSE